PIALGVGNTIITTTVTAGDGTTNQSYTVTITRAASSVATLSNLSFSAGALSPPFASGTTTGYTISVPNTTATTTVTPTATNGTATITVNGTAVASGGTTAPIALGVGNTVITTTVTAGDGTTNESYTVTITRAGSSDATLSNLVFSAGALTPPFASGTTTGYTISVPN